MEFAGILKEKDIAAAVEACQGIFKNHITYRNIYKPPQYITSKSNAAAATYINSNCISVCTQTHRDSQGSFHRR